MRKNKTEYIVVNAFSEISEAERKEKLIMQSKLFALWILKNYTNQIIIIVLHFTVALRTLVERSALKMLTEIADIYVRLSKGFGDLIVPDDVYDNLLNCAKDLK